MERPWEALRLSVQSSQAWLGHRVCWRLRGQDGQARDTTGPGRLHWEQPGALPRHLRRAAVRWGLSGASGALSPFCSFMPRLVNTQQAPALPQALCQEVLGPLVRGRDSEVRPPVERPDGSAKQPYDHG